MVKSASAFSELFDHSVHAYDPNDLRIRTMATICADKKVVVDDVFFEGGDFLFCISGSWRFSFRGADPVTIGSHELLVIYPGNFVTIEALDRHSRLDYVILNGAKVGDYLDSFGFHDLMHFNAHPQLSTMHELHNLAEREPENPAVISLLSDLCRTWAAEFRQQGQFLISEVIRALNANLKNGITRLQPLCDELKISRSSLERLFRERGLPQPGEFIRRAQVRASVWQLLNTTTPIADIARSVGINSAVYFTAFMKRQTGFTPSAIRKSGLPRSYRSGNKIH